MPEKRVTWISLSKAIALMLVIFVHSTPRDPVSGALTGFILPVFFILYGVTHDNDRHRQNIKSYLKSRFRFLMIPYFLLTILMVVIYAICYPAVNYGFTPLSFGYWSLYGSGPPGRVSHLWFLRTMFIAIVLFSLIDKYLYNKNGFYRFSIIAILPAIGVSLKTLLGVSLVPWGFDSVFIALSFIMIGNEVRRVRHINQWTISPLIDGFTIPISMILFLFLASMNGFVNIGESIYGQSIYIYMMTGLLGTYFLGVLSYHAVNHSKRISVVGIKFNKYSQEIYELHPLLIQLNIQFLSGFAIWRFLTIYPGTPLFLANITTSILLSWVIADLVINRSKVLKFIFCGVSPMTPKVIPVTQPEVEIKEPLIIQDIIVQKTNEELAIAEEA